MSVVESGGLEGSRVNADVLAPGQSGVDTHALGRSMPRAASTRSAIMAAARTAFMNNGIQATRLAAVARAAWVAPSTVSMHFKGKEALFAECLDEEIDWLFEGAFARVGGHPYPILSGDFLRILARRLHRYPLLRMSLATSPSQWGQRYYSSAHLATVRHATLRDITKGRENGIVRLELEPETSAATFSEIQSWSLWTAAREDVDFTHIERVIDATKAAVLPADKLPELHEECRVWRTMASKFQRSQMNASAIRIPSIGALSERRQPTS